MTGGAVGVIADVLAQHRMGRSMRITPTEQVEWWTCSMCGWSTGELPADDPGAAAANRAHVAAAVVDALGGLGRESFPMPDRNLVSTAWEDEHRNLRRWVSGWVREPAEEGL